jgi:hypothetical protein
LYAAPAAVQNEEMDEEYHEQAIEPVLDLHTFRPSEVKDLVPEYLRVAKEKGLYSVRIIHGKGKGVLRDTVHRILENHPDVREYGLAPAQMGGWGATIVVLGDAAADVVPADAQQAPQAIYQPTGTWRTIIVIIALLVAAGMLLRRVF